MDSSTRQPGPRWWYARGAGTIVGSSWCAVARACAATAFLQCPYIMLHVLTTLNYVCFGCFFAAFFIWYEHSGVTMRALFHHNKTIRSCGSASSHNMLPWRTLSELCRVTRRYARMILCSYVVRCISLVDIWRARVARDICGVMRGYYAYDAAHADISYHLICGARAVYMQHALLRRFTRASSFIACHAQPRHAIAIYGAPRIYRALPPLPHADRKDRKEEDCCRHRALSSPRAYISFFV